jgi:hypothetical protein
VDGSVLSNNDQANIDLAWCMHSCSHAAANRHGLHGTMIKHVVMLQPIVCAWDNDQANNDQANIVHCVLHAWHTHDFAFFG